MNSGLELHILNNLREWKWQRLPFFESLCDYLHSFKFNKVFKPNLPVNMQIQIGYVFKHVQETRVICL